VDTRRTALLVSANRRDEVELEVFDTEIYEFAVADGEMKAITSRRGPDGSPKVSPDGGTIAYLGYDDRYVSHQVSKIQGWIIKPPDFDPSKKYPLILEIHGGPVANYGDRFSVEKQLLASAGYVVLYANPRGSTSYGEEFGNLIHYNYPGNDFDGTDNRPLTSGLYNDSSPRWSPDGSIMTCWMIGKTDRFRAAATLYPVVNWYSTALTSDIPFLAVKYEFPGFPWDHPEE
jgi:dipeptidyl aminopeptidase/acylaminoacyl peptidase